MVRGSGGHSSSLGYARTRLEARYSARLYTRLGLTYQFEDRLCSTWGSARLNSKTDLGARNSAQDSGLHSALLIKDQLGNWCGASSDRAGPGLEPRVSGFGEIEARSGLGRLRS